MSLIIILAMVIGSFSLAYGAPTDVIGTPVEQAVERLVNLGVLEGYPDGTFRPNGNISRAEYAAVVTRAKGLKQAVANSHGTTIFGDVPGSSWSSGYINVAVQEGLIVGMGIINGVNTFGPELNITYEQAITIVVRALGYETEAQSNGGYPNGHLLVAAQKGLLQGINGSKGLKATRGMVAQLTYNALEVPMAGTSGSTAVYLFNDLHRINAAAASGNWASINAGTFAAAGITGVTASNIANLKATLQSAASGTNQNWSPSAIQGVLVNLPDIDSPEIMEIESKTGTAIASSVKVKFNEPIKSIGSVKIDNILRTPTGFVAGDTEANFTGLALSTSTLHSIEIIGLKDQADNTAGILTEMFAVEVDESLLTDLQRATAAVTKFQLSQYQVDKDAAQLLVNLLPAGANRVALQLLIDAVVVIPQPVVTGVQAAPVVETTTGVDAVAAVAAQVGVKGSLTLVGGDITITAKNTITDGSDIKIALIHQVGNNLPLQVALSGKEIQVGLATNGLGFDSSLTAEVVAAINANPGASALVTATGGSSSVASTMVSTPLAGGLATIVASPAMPAVKAVYTLEITRGPNANGNAIVKGIGADVPVAVINGMTKDMVAAAMAADAGLIANATVDGYVITSLGNKVIFTAITAGAIGGTGPAAGLLNVTVE